MTSPSYVAFPSLNFSGPPVDPREHIEKGTGAAKFGGLLGAIVVMLVLMVVTYGIALILIPIGWIADHLNRKKVMALLKGSSIEVGPSQFPELHACAQQFAQRLGLRGLPAIYIVEGNVINAAAMRVGSRQVITLVDDVVDACLRSGDPRSIGFVLAHEMAHHALGHTGRWATTLSSSYKKLSRLNELSCDRVALALVGEPEVAAQGLLTLLTGPHLVPYVNVDTVMRQAQEVASDKVTLQAERRLSHPLLLRRLHRILSSSARA